MQSYKEYLEESRAQVKEIGVDEARRLYEKNDGEVQFVDIRGRGEMALGYIRGAVLIPADELEMNGRHLLPDRQKTLILYCSAGDRSVFTALTLKEMGYTDVRTLAGGMNGWLEAGYDIENETLFTREQLMHYSRQMLLPQVGVEGQMQLLKAKVLVVGAGGLGCPSTLYLAAAGVGTIGIVDFDRVDSSNLNRQVLHTVANVGKPKTESAKEAIARLNPDVNVITFNQRLTPENARELVSGFDIVLDGTDNFSAKYLLNDAAFFAGKPYVFGAAVRTEGQASVFFPAGGGPCLRCMMPVPPRPDLVPT